jgi:hypothetical protein
MMFLVPACFVLSWYDREFKVVAERLCYRLHTMPVPHISCVSPSYATAFDAAAGQTGCV